VAETLRIVQLNLAYAPDLTSPDAVLARYHTLTGWSRALSGAGADVCVVQRFSVDARLAMDAVRYDFVREGRAGVPSAWAPHPRVVRAVCDAVPDVVHVNGLMFPGVVRGLRTSLPAQVAIVLQDHSGYVPQVGSWPMKPWVTKRWRQAFEVVDAVTFTAAALSRRWHEVGLAPDVAILEIPEASSEFVAIDRTAAKHGTDVEGSPALLWVGRLDANKDPITVLRGIELAAARLPGVACWMIYNSAEIEDRVRDYVAGSAELRDRVRLIGAIAPDRLPAYYSAADIFVSASQHEGSGYALIEALACGLTPCVTDIPPFRALTGSCGKRWQPRSPTACAAAIVDLGARDLIAERLLVRRHFERALSWDAIGRQTVVAYQSLVLRRTAMVE
jgi:glycosyltransferase involved in cell wall biosynthesis